VSGWVGGETSSVLVGGGEERRGNKRGWGRYGREGGGCKCGMCEGKGEGERG